METKEIIGLDLGQKRTGVARASTAARIPEPLFSVDTDQAIATVKNLTKGQDLEAIVVGLPRNLAGDDTDQTRWARKWVDEAKDALPGPLFWQDEALTTHHANVQLSNHKVKDIDAVSAAIILKDFLDTPASKRVPC